MLALHICKPEKPSLAFIKQFCLKRKKKKPKTGLHKTKSLLKAKQTRLPSNKKTILHVCLTFRHHYTSRQHTRRDITLPNGSIKSVQQSPFLKPLHSINLSYLTFLKPCHLVEDYNCSLFSGLS